MTDDERRLETAVTRVNERTWPPSCTLRTAPQWRNLDDRQLALDSPERPIGELSSGSTWRSENMPYES